MFFSRCFLMLAALLLVGLSDPGFAAQRSHGMITKAERSLRGTWYSTEGTITFKDNGTINFKGKRYYYAVSNGGLIQLSGCLLYTSDAADDLTRVDLGGRRIIKKKK